VSYTYKKTEKAVYFCMNSKGSEIHIFLVYLTIFQHCVKVSQQTVLIRHHYLPFQVVLKL